MKILVITNLYPPHEIGGYEIRCRDLCERLREFGHEIHVLTSDHVVGGRDSSGDVSVTRKLKIHGMYGHPWLPIHRLRDLELHNHTTLSQEIAAIRPDLIHVWNMGGISKSLLLRLEETGLPLVYDISDHWIARSLRADVWLSWWNGPGSSARSVARKLLTLTGIRNLISRTTPTRTWEAIRFSRIYFCSAFMRDFTASKNWPVSHASVIHCGIDTAAFDVKSSHETFNRLLWVGRMNDDKDPFTAIRALAEAHRRGLTDLTLDLYGGGTPEDLARVDAEIASLGLKEHVQRRSVPADEMRALYARYDALVFTSNWGEPFALTPLEAGASGLPVISSLDGGQAELVQDGINSVKAQAADASTYADAIVRLHSDRELREKIAIHALNAVRDKFDIAPISRQIERFLIETLEQHPTTRSSPPQHHASPPY